MACHERGPHDSRAESNGGSAWESNPTSALILKDLQRFQILPILGFLSFCRGELPDCPQQKTALDRVVTQAGLTANNNCYGGTVRDTTGDVGYAGIPRRSFRPVPSLEHAAEADEPDMCLVTRREVRAEVEEAVAPLERP